MSGRTEVTVETGGRTVTVRADASLQDVAATVAFLLAEVARVPDPPAEPGREPVGFVSVTGSQVERCDPTWAATGYGDVEGRDPVRRVDMVPAPPDGDERSW